MDIGTTPDHFNDITTDVIRAGALNAEDNATIRVNARRCREHDRRTSNFFRAPRASSTPTIPLTSGNRRGATAAKAPRIFPDYQASFNVRTTLAPSTSRALCKNATAVSVMVDWCRSNSLPFAIRMWRTFLRRLFTECQRCYRHPNDQCKITVDAKYKYRGRRGWSLAWEPVSELSRLTSWPLPAVVAQRSGASGHPAWRRLWVSGAPGLDWPATVFCR